MHALAIADIKYYETMYTASSYLSIPNFLNEGQLEQIFQFQSTAIYGDGKHTATEAAKEVKNNLQMNTECAAYSNIQQILLTAMNHNGLFRNAVLPKNIYPFLISKYTQDMGYGWHVDSQLMGNMMRTDVAMTIFLNDPEEYEGGELELQSATGQVLYKLKKGDAVCYPCTQLHRVREVTNGERHVAVTWIQSLVKMAEQRKLLFDIQQVIDRLLAQDSQSPEARLLQQNHSNLLRMWCE